MSLYNNFMGSLGSLGGSMDTLGGPMGPWDRWDLGTDGTWASRTPDTSSEDTSSELFIDTRPGPVLALELVMLSTPGARINGD